MKSWLHEFLNVCAKWRSRPLYPLEKSPMYLTEEKRLGGSRYPSGRCGEDALCGNEHPLNERERERERRER